MSDIENIVNQVSNLIRTLDPAMTESSEVKNFDCLELPIVVSEIVDYLQPQLKPYEAAVYWFFIRNTYLKDGNSIILTSRAKLGKNVIVSRSGRSADLSDAAVAKTLRDMESKGIIEQAGDSTRAGTPYRVFLPEDIQICQDRKNELNAAAEATLSESTKVMDKVDYYNNITNRLEIFERDEYKCTYCGKELTRMTATLDHLTPQSDGGEHTKENLVTSCLACNSKRGNRPVQDAMNNVQSTEVQN